MVETLAAALEAGPYQAYTYAYPHKTAYRPLQPAVALDQAWAKQDRSNLFLYLHIPFCEMRCGFCNLFTMVGADQTLEAAYLQALERQADQVFAALAQAGGTTRIARLAIGGGTPTILAADDLARLFTLTKQVLAHTDTPQDRHIPISIETSPATVTPERLAVLRAFGVDRVSIGIQSFIEAEVQAVGRSQKTSQVVAALELLQAAQFATLNLDLIYGLPGQTRQRWLESLRQALEFAPQELFLYPLYVRPLTGLGKQPSRTSFDDLRMDLYQAGRGFLLEHGYQQDSMRIFRRADAAQRGNNNDDAGDGTGLAFDAQHDGLLGLGCGARSYTHDLHYSSEYAVGQRGVRALIEEFVGRPAAAFAQASHGVRLEHHEQQRRMVLQGLLGGGLGLAAYRLRFGTTLWADWPQLAELLALGLAVSASDRLCLTQAGLAQSDALGPWLYSPVMQALMAEYQWH
jgi:oxygen-independent coproporphyrinogen III oxidase